MIVVLVLVLIFDVLGLVLAHFFRDSQGSKLSSSSHSASNREFAEVPAFALLVFPMRMLAHGCSFPLMRSVAPLLATSGAIGRRLAFREIFRYEAFFAPLWAAV